MGSFARNRQPTILQQMLEEINFQRTKEMRQSLKDDSGFVIVQGNTYWTDLFVRHFLVESEADANDTEADDILFFVRKKHVKGTSRNLPKYDTEVDVYRKDSRKLPIGDPDVDWEETVYLNLIIHQFNYTLTLAICTRTSPKELQVLRRHSQRVYASPSRRKMDTKGEGEEMTFPHICFMVDNFDEVFSDIMVRDGEMVCVELVASDRDGTVQGVIFLGSIRYDALKKVYDSRQSSLSSKVAQRMTFGLFSAAGPQTRCEFVRMKGPQGKGHAEMAVTKPKGSGVETPTSEPGFCATDMWDEWEEESDGHYTNRHQRRLSDPSANLNNFNRHGWKAKPNAQHGSNSNGGGGADGGRNDDGETVGSSAISNCFDGRARSQNEGLDSIANELSEVEAGDLKDDLPASSVQPPNTTTIPTTVQSADGAQVAGTNVQTNAKKTSMKTPNCCPGCFGRPAGSRRNKRWSDASAYSCAMSEMYCRACDDQSNAAAVPANATTSFTASTAAEIAAAAAVQAASPACLATLPGSSMPSTTLLNVDSELELLGQSHAKNLLINAKPLPDNKPTASGLRTDRENNAEHELEFGDDVSAGMSDSIGGTAAGELIAAATGQTQPTADTVAATCVEKCGNAKQMPSSEVMPKVDDGLIRVHGTEELPAQPAETQTTAQQRDGLCTNNGNVIEENEQCCDDDDAAVRLNETIVDGSSRVGDGKGYSTLPRVRRANSVATSSPVADGGRVGGGGGGGVRRKVPMRTTPDGTNIYYWCNLSKRTQKELDDGAYNPLWTSRGFTQTFHFWKEHRRQQSVPLNAFLTYVTLPWWSIAKDLLDHRETPILTF